MGVTHPGDICCYLKHSHHHPHGSITHTLAWKRPLCNENQAAVSRFIFFNGWCGLCVSSVQCAVFVVGLFEDAGKATVFISVDATLLRARRHLPSCLKYVHFRNAAVSLQPTGKNI